MIILGTQLFVVHVQPHTLSLTLLAVPLKKIMSVATMKKCLKLGDSA